MMLLLVTSYLIGFMSVRSKFVYYNIDPALLENKSNKSKQRLTCVCLNGSSELNKASFYIEIVQLESQEYTLQDKLWIKHKPVFVIAKKAPTSLIWQD